MGEPADIRTLRVDWAVAQNTAAKYMEISQTNGFLRTPQSALVVFGVCELPGASPLCSSDGAFGKGQAGLHCIRL